MFAFFQARGIVPHGGGDALPDHVAAPGDARDRGILPGTVTCGLRGYTIQDNLAARPDSLDQIRIAILRAPLERPAATADAGTHGVRLGAEIAAGVVAT